MYLYLTILFVACFIFSLLFNFLMLRWSRTLGRKNQSTEREQRWSADRKPAIGGVSFYMVLLISYLAYLFLVKPNLSSTDEMIHFGILLLTTLAFFTGLADDAFNTMPVLKLAAQICCGLILVFFDISIAFFNIPVADNLLTIMWTVGIMNSINMLDNMDGITASVSVHILLMAAASALPLSQDNLFYTFVCGGLVSALLGFLVFNWHPSRMFMGDTGSQLLGAMLAAMGIIFFWNNDNLVEGHNWWSKITIIITAFAVPMADTITVTINRLRAGKSPFVGGRDHTTHHLSYLGLKDDHVAILVNAISFVSLVMIAMLRWIPTEYLNIYLLTMFVYSVIVFTSLFTITQLSGKIKNVQIHEKD
ncbi:MAG: MraY family glycosyltransferase [Salibacteraceae bacterium]